MPNLAIFKKLVDNENPVSITIPKRVPSYDNYNNTSYDNILNNFQANNSRIVEEGIRKQEEKTRKIIEEQKRIRRQILKEQNEEEQNEKQNEKQNEEEQNEEEQKNEARMIYQKILDSWYKKEKERGKKLKAFSKRKRRKREKGET
jgi:septal ring factor EnvC (AmiA/AmiB activator)